ncbi:hypothetical protein GGS21DRAFT_549272 [Xylaria nigripes]|nr:hypothetical protein GGS21DRAFT_549272 [Xylaria nigripes]
MAKVIIVTGATGKQGGAVINALVSQRNEEFTILAITRDPLKSSANKLKALYPHITLVKGDLDNVPGLFKEAQRAAKKPIWGVYSVQVSMGKGVTYEGEISQGKALIDESIKAGVEHFVYSSVERGGEDVSWESPTPVPHFQTKYNIEHHLRDSTAPGTPGEHMGWTILRPVAFMDNLAPGFATKVFVSALRNHLKNKRLQWIATSDIGVFAAKAFIDPAYWNHKAIGLAGDELNFDEMDTSFEVTMGQSVPVTFPLAGSALSYLSSELGTMLRWFANVGYHADIEACRAEHPELLTMGQWLIRDSKFEHSN